MSEPQHPVFYDSTRKRQAIASFVFYFVAIVAFIAFCGFIVTIIETPNLSSGDSVRGRHYRPISSMRPSLSYTDAQVAGVPRSRTGVDLHVRARLRYVLRRDPELSDVKRRLAAEMKRDEARRRGQIALNSSTGRPITLAFYLDNAASLDSLQQHTQQITDFAPAWLTLSSDGSKVLDNQDLTAESLDLKAESTAKRAGLPIIPMLQDFSQGQLRPDILHALLVNPAKRSSVISQLLTLIEKKHYQGVNIDLEAGTSDDSADRPMITAFMTQLYSVFHSDHLIVSQDLSVWPKAYDLSALAHVNDFIVPMLYDEHTSSASKTGLGAGPIASNSWFSKELAVYEAAVPANKTVIGLAAYSYDWPIGNPLATPQSFGDATRLAQDNMDGTDGVIQTDQRSGNPYFTYYDGSNAAHIVWMQDAVTAYNQLMMASSYHPLGAALWHLGDEDPMIWSYLGKVPITEISSFNTQGLAHIKYGYFGTVAIGHGDVLRVVGTPTTGERKIAVNQQTGLIASELFTKYPSQYVIQRTGILDQNGYNKQKVVALTFDDGPDPRWTPEILNILHQYHVRATFFIVGENAESNPAIVQQEWKDGDEIGNHSFTHPEMDMITPERIKLELDATQRVIEAITGHESKLFRAPNRADSDPSTPADLAPVIDGDNLGYTFIGESIDPGDWHPGITADEIANGEYGVLQSQWLNHGNCILLHDAGGDTRAETVKALPIIISTLKAEGYRFVLVSALTGKSKDDLFPPVSGKQLMYVMWDRFAFDSSYWISRILAAIFVMTIILGIGRIIVFTVLALIQRKNEIIPPVNPAYRPAVSVVIAAYNESKVINRTISALLSGNYPNVEILVVDDGSTDGTAETVRQMFSGNETVRVIEKSNGGKASALNLGIKECSGEVIVALDADTMFDKYTVSNLVRHFEDPAIGAVSGNVKVGNRHNCWTWWQALEYITSQNFDRRAFSLLNCISVVPGAVGAWRKDAVVLAGLYSSQTLAEDTDLTFKVRQLGYRILTDNDALAYTEAPDTLRDLSKQRFRWAYGTLQCLWKHRAATFNRQYGAFGFFALPSLWIYQIAFQALAPLVDAAILWTIFYGSVFAPQFEVSSTLLLLKFWLLFTVFEVIGAYIALRLDHEDLKLLIWLPLQRFVYRQMMYYVILKSIITAIKGTRVGWGKLDRRGTVSTPVLPSETSQEDADLLKTL
jgi:cellulose synthase/poly-beta-1,6-N-acetylglucosamine synthase-like glycosyltransferase/peptidoglycan/xylan/chitin deacetylase (PgdA/CDA1 family)/spore germination protein YaaH